MWRKIHRVQGTLKKSNFFFLRWLCSHYFRQVLEALRYCHDHDIIHRDLRPHNILLANKENSAPVKLAGFGCAKRITDEDVATSGFATLVCFSIGTLEFTYCSFLGRLGDSFYISPEMALNRPHGKASDVWSAGVLLHILLSGTQPFLGTGESLRYTICSGELHVSGCRKFVSRSSSFDPFKIVCISLANFAVRCSGLGSH